MRNLGYGEQRTRAGQISYVRQASNGRFPRYHAYVENQNSGMQVNLHLDQKAASYEGTSAHGGEYEGPLVEQEMERITMSIANMKQSRASAQTTTQPKKPKKKPGLWGTLFG
jgi:hypothetical protein